MQRWVSLIRKHNSLSENTTFTTHPPFTTSDNKNNHGISSPSIWFQNWTRFHVKIEAIQCFPCYVKVTLTRKIAEGSSSSNTNPLIVRITIPGLHVQLAASRTKPFCYGLFWKNNRKRCSIFLAFPTEQDRCMHMSWLKESIKDLERYRQGEYYSALFILSSSITVTMEERIPIIVNPTTISMGRRQCGGGRRVDIVCIVGVLTIYCCVVLSNLIISHSIPTQVHGWLIALFPRAPYTS